MTDSRRLPERVYAYMERWKMTEPGTTVIVGLSGGADSVCLFSVLLLLREKLGITLRAVHVHHGLRGAEADRDMAFSGNLCREAGVPFRAERIDAAKEAEDTGCSVEEAGRIARYRIFAAEADAAGPGARIAVAHHADDQTETVLFNLFRGAGLKGLGGIRPVQGRIIRPLLQLEKKEICDYLKERNIPWVEDSTNREQEYARNYLRGTVLPGIREHINAGAGENIRRTAEFCAEADDCLRHLAQRRLPEILADVPKNPAEGAEEAGLTAAADIGKLLGEEHILQEYLVRELLSRVGCPRKDVGAVHIRDILALCGKETGKRIDLPYGIRAQVRYGALLLGRDGGAETAEKGAEVYSGVLPAGEAERFTFRLLSGTDCAKIPDAEYTKWLDYATIKGGLSVRSRKRGDYIYTAEGVKKTLRRYMIDEKIPAAVRDRIPLLADGSHILWVVGYRISWACRITAQTRQVLQVHYRIEGGKDIGRENQGSADEGRG